MDSITLTLLVPFAWFAVAVGWVARFCWPDGVTDAVVDADAATADDARCGVVCDFDGCWLHAFWNDDCIWWLGYDWWRIWFCCIFTFKWYKLFAQFDATSFCCSLLVQSMALLLLLLVKLIIVVPWAIGLRFSIGRVSMMPLIVSAGPTITLSHDSWWSTFSNKLQCLKLSSISSLNAFITTLCLGTGGAATGGGTSNSQLVIFSELFESSADGFALFVKFTKLDAPVTLAVCGLSKRFTAELSATLGEALRGGSGGAVKLWTVLEVMASLVLAAGASAAAPAAITTAAAAAAVALLIIWCCCCCWICPDCVAWLWTIGGCWFYNFKRKREGIKI